MKAFPALRAWAAVAVLVIAGATGAAAHGGPAATQISELTASASGTAVTADGHVTFGGQPSVVVGTDPAGDNVGGPATNPAGLDLTQLEISQPTPDEPTLLFTIKLGQLATGIPEGIQYNWDIAVDGGESEGGSNWSIKSMRTRVASTTTAGPYAGLFTCVPTDTGYSCTQQALLSNVAYETEEAAIRIPVPLDAIGARPGSTITAWPRSTNPIWIGPSAAGAQTISNVFDTATHDDYTVPQAPAVTLGLAPTGQEPESVVAATVNDDHFSQELTAPGPGTYDVVAQACFASNCASKAVPVTVE